MLHNDRMVVTWYQITHYSRLKRNNVYNGTWKKWCATTNWPAVPKLAQVQIKYFHYTRL